MWIQRSPVQAGEAVPPTRHICSTRDSPALAKPLPGAADDVTCQNQPQGKPPGPWIQATFRPASRVKQATAQFLHNFCPIFGHSRARKTRIRSESHNHTENARCSGKPSCLQSAAGAQVPCSGSCCHSVFPVQSRAKNLSASLHRIPTKSSRRAGKTALMITGRSRLDRPVSKSSKTDIARQGRYRLCRRRSQTFRPYCLAVRANRYSVSRFQFRCL